MNNRNRLNRTYNELPDAQNAENGRRVHAAEALGEMSRWALYPGYSDPNELPESIDPRRLAAFVRSLLAECNRLSLVNTESERLRLDNRRSHAEIKSALAEIGRLRERLGEYEPAEWEICSREQYDAHECAD